MDFIPAMPPREFFVGAKPPIKLRDCGRVALQPDEQVTFVTEGGAEYDVCRKSWGFYATPSLNGRLADFGLRALLVRGVTGERFYLLLVEAGKEEEFADYLKHTGMNICCWLDSDAAFATLERQLQRAS